MLRLGYTKGSMTFYRSQWKALLLFAQERKQIIYSEQLGLDFLEKHLHIFENDLNHTLTQSEVQKLRIIRMVGDFQLHRTILRRYYKPCRYPQLSIKYFKSIFAEPGPHPISVL